MSSMSVPSAIRHETSGRREQSGNTNGQQDWFETQFVSCHR